MTSDVAKCYKSNIIVVAILLFCYIKMNFAINTKFISASFI